MHNPKASSAMADEQQQPNPAAATHVSDQTAARKIAEATTERLIRVCSELVWPSLDTCVGTGPSADVFVDARAAESAPHPPPGHHGGKRGHFAGRFSHSIAVFVTVGHLGAPGVGGMHCLRTESLGARSVKW